MQLKNYIAAFLVIVFLGKMISMDAKFLGMVFDTSEVTLVNKLCPKKQLQTDSAGEYTTDSFSPSFEIDYLCHTAFNIQLDEFSQALTEDNFKKYSYRAPGIFSIPGEKFYPPPKA